MKGITFTYKIKGHKENTETDFCFRGLKNKDLSKLEKLEYEIHRFTKIKDKYIPFLQRIFKDLCEIEEKSDYILFKVKDFVTFNSYSKIISFLSFPRYLEEFDSILEKIDFTKTDCEIFTELCELSVKEGNNHAVISSKSNVCYYIPEFDQLEFDFKLENYLTNIKTINHKSSFRYLFKEK